MQKNIGLMLILCLCIGGHLLSKMRHIEKSLIQPNQIENCDQYFDSPTVRINELELTELSNNRRCNHRILSIVLDQNGPDPFIKGIRSHAK